ncbi:MAG: hypothetical protein KDA68_09300 [Planctomycetaceae bacterium]|nr:hypothetical protein [Planctomycetaceae bacterium]
MDLKKLFGNACALLVLQTAFSAAAEPDQPSFVDKLVEPTSFFNGSSVGEYLSTSADNGSFFYGGTEFSFLRINAHSGGQIAFSQSDTTAPGVATVAFRDGNGMTDTGYAPRLWIGRRFGEEKWGIQSRYWHLSQSGAHFPDASAPPTGTNFSTVTEADRLEAYTIDLEGVRSYQPGDWKIDTFLGARHASFDIDSQIHTFGVFTTGNFTNLFLANGSSFDGTGLTYGLAARRPISGSNFNLFASARGGSLWGQTDSYGRAAGAVASSPSAPLLGAATVTRNNAKADLQIAEIQVGLEWNHALECVPANFFCRTSYEYQYWNINGLPTGGAGFGGTIGELTTNSFSSAGLGDMRLNGFSFATGLTW